jgi:hypothetical protein
LGAFVAGRGSATAEVTLPVADRIIRANQAGGQPAADKLVLVNSDGY